MQSEKTERCTLSKNILLVDDEPLILSSLARQMRGHKVFRAGDVFDALGVLEDEEIDLVLTDYHMPGGDGVSLLDVVRRKYPGVRRAMMSADPPLNIGELVHAGVVEFFFSKPFGISLAAKILDLLREEPRVMSGTKIEAPVVEHNASM